MMVEIRKPKKTELIKRLNNNVPVSEIEVLLKKFDKEG